ncbi:hypothetical protein [Edaphocola flava]|uniref:hypothetical protein n=1 Tax=Edaphocola flava TaxID=2499629 RepID=UPI00100B3274|nr:hypothetical protein [Edaphocola flava]
MNKYISIMATGMLCLGLSLTAAAQQKSVLTQISNPGRVFPSADLESYKPQLEQQFGTEKAAIILSRVTQKGWPEAINTIEERLEDRAQNTIKKFKVRTVAMINSNYCLVSVSPADNPGLDDAYYLSSGEPFYMLVGKDGIKNPVAPPLAKAKPAGATPAKSAKTQKAK